MKEKFEWKIIFNERNIYGYRAKVPGGWLHKEEVESDIFNEKYEENLVRQVCITFISDPEHKWEIAENEEWSDI